MRAAALVATCCAFEPATLLLVALIGGSVAGLVLVAAGIQRLATALGMPQFSLPCRVPELSRGI